LSAHKQFETTSVRLTLHVPLAANGCHLSGDNCLEDKSENYLPELFIAVLFHNCT